ncbi:unnamed protein product, partial [Durusdinium trenchii]
MSKMTAEEFAEAVITANALGNDRKEAKSAKEFRLKSAQLNLSLQRPALELEELQMALMALTPDREDVLGSDNLEKAQLLLLRQKFRFAASSPKYSSDELHLILEKLEQLEALGGLEHTSANEPELPDLESRIQLATSQKVLEAESVEPPPPGEGQTVTEVPASDAGNRIHVGKRTTWPQSGQQVFGLEEGSRRTWPEVPAQRAEIQGEFQDVSPIPAAREVSGGEQLLAERIVVASVVDPLNSIESPVKSEEFEARKSLSESLCESFGGSKKVQGADVQIEVKPVTGVEQLMSSERQDLGRPCVPGQGDEAGLPQEMIQAQGPAEAHGEPILESGSGSDSDDGFSAHVVIQSLRWFEWQKRVALAHRVGRCMAEVHRSQDVGSLLLALSWFQASRRSSKKIPVAIPARNEALHTASCALRWFQHHRSLTRARQAALAAARKHHAV